MTRRNETGEQERTAPSTLNRVTRRKYLAYIGTGSTALVGASASVQANSTGDTHDEDGRAASLAARFKELTRGTEWEQVSDESIEFTTYHTQGMSRVGEQFVLSSVEIQTETESYETPHDGYDRSPGEGVGHLFKFDTSGALIDESTLGEDIIYHPGGIDYDGQYVWVPVAEYRPESRSIIYRVDPDSMEVTEVFRYPDHIGGIVHNTDSNTLHGVSWGSRRFYRWEVNDSLEVTNADQPPHELYTLNSEFYIDYQDCQYIGNGFVLCSGLAGYEPPDTSGVELGGIDLWELQSDMPVHQIPVPAWTEGGVAMTHNPFFVEERFEGLRFYFVPEDDESHLFVYDVT